MKHVLFHIFSLLLCYLYFSSFQSGFENQKWLWAAIILAFPSQKTRFLSWGLTWRIVAFSSRHNLTPTVTNWFESCHRMYMLGVLLERMACLWQFSNSRHGRLCYSRHQHHPSCFPWSPGPGESGEKTLSQQPDVEVVRGCDGKPHTKGKQEFHLISFASEALNSVKRFLAARTLSNTKELQWTRWTSEKQIQYARHRPVNLQACRNASKQLQARV